eukprot:356543-Chlamydomonas_euryale.AAC.2
MPPPLRTAHPPRRSTLSTERLAYPSPHKRCHAQQRPCRHPAIASACPPHRSAEKLKARPSPSKHARKPVWSWQIP